MVYKVINSKGVVVNATMKGSPIAISKKIMKIIYKDLGHKSHIVRILDDTKNKIYTYQVYIKVLQKPKNITINGYTFKKYYDVISKKI